MEHDYKKLWEYEMTITAELRQKIDKLEKAVREKEDACDKLEADLRSKYAEIDDLNNTIADSAVFTSFLSGKLNAYQNVINTMFGGKAE